MRAYPHKPDAENVEFNLQSSLEQIKKLKDLEKAGKVNPNPRFFQTLGEEQTAAAGETYALEKPIAEVLEYLRDASRNFARAVDHKVEIDPVEFVDMLAAAVVAGDNETATRLARLSRKDYTSDEVGASEIHYLVAEILSDLVLGREKELASRIAAAQKQLAGKKVSREEHLWADSLVALAAAILARQQPGIDAALAAREKEYAKTYRAPDERETPDSLLDVAALAFLRFAAQNGLTYSGNNAYIPRELIKA